jgi:hypothetical protein
VKGNVRAEGSAFVRKKMVSFERASGRVNATNREARLTTVREEQRLRMTSKAGKDRTGQHASVAFCCNRLYADGSRPRTTEAIVRQLWEAVGGR